MWIVIISTKPSGFPIRERQDTMCQWCVCGGKWAFLPDVSKPQNCCINYQYKSKRLVLTLTLDTGTVALHSLNKVIKYV